MPSKVTMNDTPLTFTITVQEANTILAGLQELPAKLCNPLTKKLQEQAREQLKSQETTQPE